MTAVLRLVVAAALVPGAAAPATPAASQPAAAATTMKAAPHSGVESGVMLVTTLDASGSMRRVVEALATAEIGQIKRSLRPGDLYARIPFNATARIAILQQIHAPGDVELIAGVLVQNSVATGRTALSSGLIAGMEVVKRHRGNRHVVLIVPTDAINDPADGVEAERRRLTDVTAWWRALPDSQRIVVGVDRGSNRANLKAFAEALGAKLVTPASFAEQSVVERAVVAARPLPSIAAPVPQAPVRKTPNWRPWALGAGALLLASFMVIRRRTRQILEASRALTEAPFAIPASPSAASELVVTVALNGRVHEKVVETTSLEAGAVTLGASGTVAVPSLPGCPISIEIVSGELSITVAPGQGIRIDGESADAVPQPMHVGREARLAARGASITVQLRRAGAKRPAKPLLVVGFGGNR